VVGELDMLTYPRLLEELQAATVDGPRHLVLDLSRVTFFSAAGVRLLLQTRTAQDDDHRMLRLVPSGRIWRMLDALDMASEFERSDDVGAAVAACAADRV
jgi:anti-anti-sigma factor